MQGHGPKQTGGLLVGGGLGALAGSQMGMAAENLPLSNWKLAGAALGTASGSPLDRLIGWNVGRGEKMRNTPDRFSNCWENPSSGNYGSITPRREGRHRRSARFAEFSNSLTIDGQTEDFVGVACRARDGR